MSYGDAVLTVVLVLYVICGVAITWSTWHTTTWWAKILMPVFWLPFMLMLITGR